MARQEDEAREIKYAALRRLFVPTMVLALAAISIATKGEPSIFNTGIHGFTETLYAHDSQGNNNGGVRGLRPDEPARTSWLGTLFLGPVRPMFAALALGGARQEEDPPASAGTFRGRADVRRLTRRRDRLTAGLMIFPADPRPIVEGLMP